MVSLQKESEDKCREVAQKIVDLTGYGQALHVNDILPDLRELLANREKEIAEEVKRLYPFGGHEEVIKRIIEIIKH